MRHTSRFKSKTATKGTLISKYNHKKWQLFDYELFYVFMKLIFIDSLSILFKKHQGKVYSNR